MLFVMFCYKSEKSMFFTFFNLQINVLTSMLQTEATKKKQLH